MAVIVNDLEVILEPPAPGSEGSEGPERPARGAGAAAPQLRPGDLDDLVRHRLERLARVCAR